MATHWQLVDLSFYRIFVRVRLMISNRLGKSEISHRIFSETKTTHLYYNLLQWANIKYTLWCTLGTDISNDLIDVDICLMWLWTYNYSYKCRFHFVIYARKIMYSYKLCTRAYTRRRIGPRFDHLPGLCIIRHGIGECLNILSARNIWLCTCLA